MDKPEIIQRMESSFLELLTKDDKPDVSIKDVAEWEGMSSAALRQMNYAHELPYGMAYKLDERTYHHINKLVLFNYVSRGGRI